MGQQSISQSFNDEIARCFHNDSIDSKSYNTDVFLKTDYILKLVYLHFLEFTPVYLLNFMGFHLLIGQKAKFLMFITNP